jgi:hypothetical protein
MIHFDQLMEMFADFRKRGAWDIDGPMLWGYFFTNRTPTELELAIPALESMGYRFVDLFIPQLDPGVEEYYFLHVERVEAHTVESLNQRNQEFEQFAEQFNLDSYDGMDVGPLAEP